GMMLGAVTTSIEGTLDAASTVEGQVRVGKGASIERSRLRGPLVIGAGARVRDSYIGPFTSIGDEVELDHCEIEHSIVLERSRLVQVAGRIESSLIGREVTVTSGDHRPRAHRLMLGDSSRVELAW